MFIKSINLTNFRCFRSLGIDFDEKLTVFVAENGQGKTTILDALAISFDQIVTYYAGGRSDAPGRALLQRHDVYYGQPTSTVHASICADSKHVLEWTDSIELPTPDKEKRSSGKRTDELQDYLHRQWQGESLDDAPLTVFYRARRAYSSLADPKKFKLQSFTVKDAFKGALEGATGFEATQHWFYQVENEELREKNKRKDFDYQDPRLKAVREAIHQMIRQTSNLGFEAGGDGLSVSWQGGNEEAAPKLLLTQLSDGYRTMLSLVMDLATRLVIANPSSDTPLHSQCVVMIDEIDLHLHPRWQQEILPDLQRVFPNIQLIVTTHSPQILSTVKPESIRILQNGNIIRDDTKHSYGVQSHRILNEIMGVSARPQILELEQKKEKLMKLIPLGSSDIDPLLEDLSRTLGDLDHFIINAKAELLRSRK